MAGCWLWQGATVKQPEAYGGDAHYGKAYAYGRLQPTHRLVYKLMVGPIPEGLELDHKCRVPLCCNPAHLEAVTRGD